MPEKPYHINGLSDEQVIASRNTYGKNILNFKKESGLMQALKSLLKEPMVILLFIASSIYFATGNSGDGIFLAIAIVLVAAISLFQDSRSRNALEKLKQFIQPTSKVIRNGVLVEIKSEDIVVGDSMMVEEGMTIAADGIIAHSNDFSVNESLLTGESFSVFKDLTTEDHTVFKGTMVASGLAIATIIAVGNETQLGKIGKSLESIQEEKTPLEKQINNFVKKMVILGSVVFLFVWLLNYLRSYNILDSLLKALTLAMSILPEEIPVAFTTFMAIGSWRLMKMGVVVKQMKTVETLGSATVICIDKTGTITENKMTLAKVFAMTSGKISSLKIPYNEGENELISIAMWASEPIPFDPMEIALHKAYSDNCLKDRRNDYKMIHEYPLGGQPPMMTHVFENNTGNKIIAAKGAPEAFFEISNFTSIQKKNILEALQRLTQEGYRVLGVAQALFEGENFPKRQQDFSFNFKGIVAFYDPPKKNIGAVLNDFASAGIAVKIITGDNSATTISIANQIGFKGIEKNISGNELMLLNEKQLQQKVLDTAIFTRMFPEAKLKIINALKKNNEIVAMTGDGVNDGPALKAAHIGVAMGEKGTEIAKQAASLILTSDDLSKMVDAIGMGRRIYTNLKKAIQYIISIHIPIVLTVFIPLAFGWIYPNILSPIHVILLELIMGPTCSIIYENEPMEKNTMNQNPRPFMATFFSWKELTTSVFQGFMITTGVLIAYLFAVQQGYNESTTRAMVFTVLITSNIFLTLVNRSFYYSIFTTLKYKNNLVPLIIGVTILLTGVLLYIDPFTAFFKFKKLNFEQLGISICIGFLSVIWYEFIKAYKRLFVSK